MAFDKVDHRSMAIALQRLGVHRQYVDMIGDLYTDQTFTVKGFQNGSITATPHTGIRQGCPLSPYLFIMVMTVLFYDVHKRLRTTGVPTNTWSIGKPIYDLEYADVLLSVTPPEMEEFLKSVQVEASLYGMELIMAETEVLADTGSTPPAFFVDGTPVPSSDSIKYLRSHITWSNLTKKAIDARKALAHTRYMKLQPLWRSRLSRATKVIYQASVVPALTYGLDTLSLEVRHLKPIDAWYYQHLRRSIGIKASYYSRVSNNQVWIQAGKPAIPSQQLVSSQLRQLANILTRSTSDPRYHVVFSPGCRDRVKFTKGTKRGHPQRYWLELITETALPVLKEYAEYAAQEHRHDVLGIRQLLNKDTGFEEYLVTAPTRQKSFFARHVQHLGCAWQP